jgi:hypothetical protein
MCDVQQTVFCSDIIAFFQDTFQTGHFRLQSCRTWTGAEVQKSILEAHEKKERLPSRLGRI